MTTKRRTLLIGLAAGALAIGGGAVVADAANHPSFADSGSQQSGFGGGGPGGGGFNGGGMPQGGSQGESPPWGNRGPEATSTGDASVVG